MQTLADTAKEKLLINFAANTVNWLTMLTTNWQIWKAFNKLGLVIYKSFDLNDSFMQAVGSLGILYKRVDLIK